MCHKTIITRLSPHLASESRKTNKNHFFCLISIPYHQSIMRMTFMSKKIKEYTVVRSLMNIIPRRFMRKKQVFLQIKTNKSTAINCKEIKSSTSYNLSNFRFKVVKSQSSPRLGQPYKNKDAFSIITIRDSFRYKFPNNNKNNNLSNNKDQIKCQ